jgi:hypothetical protein
MGDYAMAAMFFIIGLGLGNSIGDQGTLRDCATKNQARMASGGTIECTVKKDPI